jgi:hypothetical protein
MNVPVVHYDIRAVAGVTRAACGIDNTIDEFDVFQSSNNRNYITCEDCRAKIDLLAEFGVVYYGAIEESSEDYMVRLMKRAIAEDRAEETKRVQDWERLVQERAWRVLGISG